CSSFNKYQTMPPCLIYIPGMPPGDVDFVTSHADIMPSIVDTLGCGQNKPNTLGRSIFQPVPTRYAIVANFEYGRVKRWAVVTDDRRTILERSGRELEIIRLGDWEGRWLSFRAAPDAWNDNLRIIRELQAEVRFYVSD